jgi:hypothetical protein
MPGRHSVWIAEPALESGDRMTTKVKRRILISFDISGLILAWAMFGTRYLPYFVLAFVALYCFGRFMTRRDQPE